MSILLICSSRLSSENKNINMLFVFIPQVVKINVSKMYEKYKAMAFYLISSCA